MNEIITSLHDGSGFAEEGSLVKWATKPLLNDQKKRIRRHGPGPFTILGGSSLSLYFIDQNGINVKAKPQWLVPAKSLLTAVLDELALRSIKKREVNQVILLANLIASADLTATERSQTISRLEEIITILSKKITNQVDTNMVFIHDCFKNLIAKSQGK